MQSLLVLGWAAGAIDSLEYVLNGDLLRPTGSFVP